MTRVRTYVRRGYHADRIRVHGCTFCSETTGCLNIMVCKDHVLKLLDLRPQAPWRFSYKDYLEMTDATLPETYEEYLEELFSKNTHLSPSRRAADESWPERQGLKGAVQSYISAIDDSDDDGHERICPIMRKHGITADLR